jgi:hypothetical protein
MSTGKRYSGVGGLVTRSALGYDLFVTRVYFLIDQLD